jgi:hypothetical protein
MTTGIPQNEWPGRLQAFTQRNAGRNTVMNELAAELGDQELEHGYPLRGVSYDPRDRCINIMLGDLEGTEHHLTRGIADVRSVDISSTEDGRDLALRIERSDGATILKFDDDGQKAPTCDTCL